MKKITFIIVALVLVSAGCQKVELKKEIPTSPIESYQPLPK